MNSNNGSINTKSSGSLPERGKLRREDRYSAESSESKSSSLVQSLSSFQLDNNSEVNGDVLLRTDLVWYVAKLMEKNIASEGARGETEAVFSEKEMMAWMVQERSCPVQDDYEASVLGNEMVQMGILRLASVNNKENHFCFTPAFYVQRRVSITSDHLLEIAGRVMAAVEVQDRIFVLDSESSMEEEIIYPECFLGTHAVEWMIIDEHIPVETIEQAEDMGNYLVQKGFLSYGVDVKGRPGLPFANQDLFYRLAPKVKPISYEQQDQGADEDVSEEAEIERTLARPLESTGDLQEDIVRYQAREKRFLAIISDLKLENDSFRTFIDRVHTVVMQGKKDYVIRSDPSPRKRSASNKSKKTPRKTRAKSPSRSSSSKRMLLSPESSINSKKSSKNRRDSS